MRRNTEILALEEGQTILIAYHLYKRCFSIRNANTRKVIGYTDRIVICNVRFLVSLSGRERVLRENKKNVHAYVKGEYAELQNISIDDGDVRQAYYNPYFTPAFVDRITIEPIQCADMAICEDGKVFYRVL
ncbi:hypothetical protein [Cohnella abietis]|uniref:Uncharacterized protein n=1 Tax=Cohnella abietis TaxID=2507935 RepID=A0A3T1CZG9_9BACL|nr:hypothetical protein [Cohnella abietis]BBI31155.1 hypothetical protein KCTCHS21_05540 [Cohnella abietis]